jgi:hypothetical protein
MENCAKCRKELDWAGRNAFWNRQLKKGYLSAPLRGNYGVLTAAGIRKECPEYKDKKLCRSCFVEVLGSDGTASPSGSIRGLKDSEYRACIENLGLLEGEEIRLQYVCLRQFISRPIGAFVTQPRTEQKKGLLVFTNDNMIFMQQEGMWSSNYSQALRFPLESISGVVSGGTLMKHVRILVGAGGVSEEHQFLPFAGQGNAHEMIGSVQKLLREVREEKKRLALAAVATGSLPAMIFCKFCGARNKADQTRCGNCGALLG